MLQVISEPDALRRAWLRVWRNGGAAGTDGVTCEDFAARVQARLTNLSHRLRAGKHHPLPYRVLTLDRPGRTPRVLRVPAVEDRIVQTALAQALRSASETTASEASFAYRPGRSVMDACAEVHKWCAEGSAEWILDADIRSCFDRIRHVDVREVLHAWGCGADPIFAALIERWLAAGAAQKGRGIAQGSPLSPTLANGVLGKLDAALAAEDFRFVRFADDFVVAADNSDRAGRALRVCTEALADIGLETHSEKTRVVRYQDGFSFLGTEFGTAISADATRQSIAGFQPETAPSSGTDDASQRDLNASEERPRAPCDIAGPSEPAPDADILTPRAQAVPRTLYLVEPGTMLGRCGERLFVRKDGVERLSLPARHLDQIVVLSNAVLSTAALKLCLAHGIGVVIAGGAATSHGTFYSPLETQLALVRAQFAARENTERRLALARAFVLGKLHNQTVLLRRYARRRPAEAVAPHLVALRNIADQARQVNCLDAVRGCEGFGAKSYFSGLRALIDPDLAFGARKAREPSDTVNSLLSFAYALLYGAVHGAVLARGLDPRIGLLHDSRGTHAGLVSDLMEEFRPLVADSIVLNAVLNAEIKPNDFTETDKGLRLVPAARRHFVHAMEAKLQSHVSVAGAEGDTTYRDAIAAQVRQFAESVSNGVPYRPFHAR